MGFFKWMEDTKTSFLGENRVGDILWTLTNYQILWQDSMAKKKNLSQILWQNNENSNI